MLDLDRITHPLRLAKGSHKPGSGKGCAMNLVSYTNGDSKITDYPDCSAPPLARMVQIVNDAYAGADGYLSAQDSVTVLDLGWRTVGTAGMPDTLVQAWITNLINDIATSHDVHGYGKLAADAAAGFWMYPNSAHNQKLAIKITQDAVAATAAWKIADAGTTSMGATVKSINPAGTPGLVRFVARHIDHWRDLMGLDVSADIEPAAVDAALARIHA